MSKTRRGVKRLVPRVIRVFFTPDDDLSSMLILDEQVTALHKPYDEIARSFKYNVSGLLSTVTIPYEMAYASTIDRHYQRIHTAERIRSLNLGRKRTEDLKSLEARRVRVAREKADELLVAFLKSNEGRDNVISDTCAFLIRAIKNEAFALAASELILQGVVLSWGAFEVLSRDCFIIHLNQRPSAIELLTNDPIAKRRFELGKVPIEVLASHGYDLSKNMGTILAEQQDLSDLNSIKAIYEALFPSDSKLKTALDIKDLRILSLRRNLVVHRRGIVDEAYIRQTGCSQKTGERLIVTPDDLYRHIETIIKVGNSIITASAKVDAPKNSAG